jgi:hypothetical protein
MYPESVCGQMSECPEEPGPCKKQCPYGMKKERRGDKAFLRIHFKGAGTTDSIVEVWALILPGTEKTVIEYQIQDQTSTVGGTIGVLELNGVFTFQSEDKTHWEGWTGWGEFLEEVKRLHLTAHIMES